MNGTNPPEAKATRRVPGIPDHIQQFGLCILLHLLFPVLPLLIERLVLGRVEHKTLFLFLGIYPLAIGISSRSKLLFGLTVVICVIYSIFFGLSVGNLELDPLVIDIGYGCLVALIIIHACERYNRHVADSEPFLEFG
jgi:hypothetical protein